MELQGGGADQNESSYWESRLTDGKGMAKPSPACTNWISHPPSVGIWAKEPEESPPRASMKEWGNGAPPP